MIEDELVQNAIEYVLTKLGAAGNAAVEVGASRVGTKLVEAIEKRCNGGVLESALEYLRTNPDDPKAQIDLKIALREILGNDEELADEVKNLLNGVSQTNTQNGQGHKNAQITGSNNKVDM